MKEWRQLGESGSGLPRVPSISILPFQGRRKCLCFFVYFCAKSMIFDPGSKKEMHAPKSTPSNDVGTDLKSCPPHCCMGLGESQGSSHHPMGALPSHTQQPGPAECHHQSQLGDPCRAEHSRALTPRTCWWEKKRCM